MTGRRALRSSSCWTRSLREIGLVEACSVEMLLFLAKVVWKREERKRRESRVLTMVFKAKTMVLQKIDRRGGQRTHEVWKEVTECEKAVHGRGLRGITEASCSITEVVILSTSIKQFSQHKLLLKCFKDSYSQQNSNNSVVN